MKRKISEGQRRRHQRIEEMNLPPVDRKRCTKCGKMKRVPEDYTMRKRTLSSGLVKEYPSGECKACTAKRSEAWREEKRKQGVLSELNKKYNANRDPDARRRYQREYEAQRRRKAGMAVRGPWKKYRQEWNETVPLEPFRQWLIAKRDEATKKGMDVQALADSLNISDRRLRTYLLGYEMKKGKKYPVNNVTVDIVDRTLLAEGNTLLIDLYPNLYNL